MSVGKELCSVAIRGAHSRAQEEDALKEAFKTFDRASRPAFLASLQPFSSAFEGWQWRDQQEGAAGP